MSNPGYHSQLIKALAISNGFDACGISVAGYLESEAPKLEKWLKEGRHGEMKYLENHFELRLDPQKLVPGAKTVVSLLYNYFPAETLTNGEFKLAKYAYGEDYHMVVREKLEQLFAQLRDELGQIEGRVFVDSAPVLERAWAERSGIGWIGKHGLLINKSKGSFFFLAELIIDLECEPDAPTKDHCGTCNKCVENCPTEAILPNKTLDANKCISYLTIELKGEIQNEFKGKMADWMFGCDICQDVCPWNRFSKPNSEQRFQPSDKLKAMQKENWLNLEKSNFDELFRKSAVKRTKFEGLKRNIAFLERD